MSEPDEPTRRSAAASPWASLFSSESFRAGSVIGPSAILDAGLPLALFTVVFSVNGQQLAPAIWTALGVGALLAVVRIVRRTPVQNVVAGFLGVALAAFFAARSGNAEDAFVPGFIINVAYGSAYLVSVLLRWPVLGLVVQFATGASSAWRTDDRLRRAYSRACLLWVGMFVVRLGVQLPLYFAGTDSLGWLATARLVMSWPLFLLVAYLSWLIIAPAYRASTTTGRAVAEPDEPESERPGRDAVS